MAVNVVTPVLAGKERLAQPQELAAAVLGQWLRGIDPGVDADIAADRPRELEPPQQAQNFRAEFGPRPRREISRIAIEQLGAADAQLGQRRRTAVLDPYLQGLWFRLQCEHEVDQILVVIAAQDMHRDAKRSLEGDQPPQRAQAVGPPIDIVAQHDQLAGETLRPRPGDLAPQPVQDGVQMLEVSVNVTDGEQHTPGQRPRCRLPGRAEGVEGHVGSRLVG